MTTAKHRPSENTPAEQNEILTSSESEPERRRRENISANLQILTELGLTQGGLVVKKNSEHEVTWANDRPKKKKKNGRSYMKLSSRNPSRVSRRLKGEPPAFTHTLDDDFVNKDDQPIPTTMTTGKTRRGTRSLWWSTKQTTGLVTTCEVPDCIEVPLTLGSISTTIWNAGSLVTGENRKRYWSGRACLYKHPYPVGYRATKRHFNQTFIMSIAEGEKGPVFSVTAENGMTWDGPTPTAPWTAACKKSPSTGTRVSGPLFFGFSDPITLKLIESLPNYDLAAAEVEN